MIAVCLRRQIADVVGLFKLNNMVDTIKWKMNTEAAGVPELGKVKKK